MTAAQHQEVRLCVSLLFVKGAAARLTEHPMQAECKSSKCIEDARCNFPSVPVLNLNCPATAVCQQRAHVRDMFQTR